MFRIVLFWGACCGYCGCLGFVGFLCIDLRALGSLPYYGYYMFLLYTVGTDRGRVLGLQGIIALCLRLATYTVCFVSAGIGFHSLLLGLRASRASSARIQIL